MLAPPTSVALLIVPNSFWRNWKRRGSAGTPSRSAKNRISLTNSTEGSRSIVSVSTVGVDVNCPEAGALVEVFDRHGLRWARVVGSDELQPHRLAAAIAFKAAREGQIEAPAVLSGYSIIHRLGPISFQRVGFLDQPASIRGLKMP